MIIYAQPGLVLRSGSRARRAVLMSRLQELRMHPLAATEARTHNLPSPISSFVGRERETTEVAEVVRAARLVTLTGAGGAGKTRLGLAVAATLRESFHDGAWLVELGPLADAAFVPQAVASVLSARESADRSTLEALVDFLRPRELLLVLDNCEHLVDACAQLADRILSTCPGVRILATSREPLRISGEVVWWVPSLATPPQYRVPVDPAELNGYPAVRLFVDRARMARPTFLVNNHNARAIADVCTRLDGNPLAIELAAARARLLSAEQILERLGDAFALLTLGSRTAPRRQQTLAAALDWSHDLLSDDEQALFRRIAVCAGGFDLAAAEAIGVGKGLDTANVLDVLTGLADKSLVVAEAGQAGAARYRMHETVRTYALERLRETDEGHAVRERHASYYLALAEEVEPRLEEAGMGRWLDYLEAEVGNFRAALTWFQSVGQVRSGLRLSAALQVFWPVRHHASEGLQWLRAFLLSDGARSQTTERAKALGAAAFLARRGNELGQAAELLDESLAIRRVLNDQKGVADALTNLGAVMLQGGDADGARQLLEEGLAMQRVLDNCQGIAEALGHLGLLEHNAGNHVEARHCYDESLQLFQQLGDTWGVAWVLAGLGDLEFEQGDYDRAAARYAETLTACRSIADQQGAAAALSNLGNTAHRQGDSRRAVAFLQDSLRLAKEMRDERQMATGLERMADVAARMGRPDLASRSLAAAHSWRSQVRAPNEVPDRRTSLPDWEAVGAGYDPAAFNAAWADGLRLTLDEAVDMALAGVQHDTSADRLSTERSISLTPREMEVAALVARGLTNRQIATELVISERTADNHVANILNKLALDNRVQIAAWAMQHDVQARHKG